MLYSFINRIAEYKNRIRSEKKEWNRFIMGSLAFLIFFDYLLFCYHAEKNPLDIFPSFPVADEKREIMVYLPDLDGRSVIEEKRRAPVIKDTESYIHLLFQMVIDGSDYENTSVVVPVDSYIREIWIYDDICAIDAGFSILMKSDTVIPGSEESFKRALSRTVTENIPAIKRVILLDKGIPGRNIWEY